MNPAVNPMPDSSISHYYVPCPKLLVSYALARVEIKMVAIERNHRSGRTRVSADNILRVRRDASLEEVECALRLASYDAPASFYCDPYERAIGVLHETEGLDGDVRCLIADLDLVIAQSVPELLALRTN